MSAIVPGQPYRDLILPCLPRARSLMDRTPSSPTIGSADRDYWNYRTLTDFSGGSWQQVMLGFAVLSTVTDAGLRRDELRTLACAALTGWLAAQHRDGSVDEWYLNERSYCATGFGAAVWPRPSFCSARICHRSSGAGPYPVWLAPPRGSSRDGIIR